MDDCLEADCAASLIHYEPQSLNVQLSDRWDLRRSSQELVRYS